MTVLFIAFLHAIPVFLSGVITGNRSVLNVTTAVMVVIAATTGSALYLSMDIVAIAIGYLACSSFLRSKYDRP